MNKSTGAYVPVDLLYIWLLLVDNCCLWYTNPHRGSFTKCGSEFKQRTCAGMKIRLKDYTGADLLPLFIVVCIGLAEMAHLAGVLSGLPFHVCAWLFAVPVLLVLVLGACLGIYAGLARGRKTDKKGKWYLVVFLLLVGAQIAFLCAYPGGYRQGDMTVEVVGSFLETDGIYRVNPMTGLAYETGIPTRLKILCLPTLYAALCRVLHMAPQVLVWRVIPILTLLGCYSAFLTVGKCIFPEDAGKRRFFLLMTAALLWAGTYLYGMGGFQLLFSGWRGVSIRNLVLLPWLISLFLRKKKLPVLLCIAAEACITWTLYGLGVCLLVAAGLMITDLLLTHRSGKEEKHG